MDATGEEESAMEAEHHSVTDTLSPLQRVAVTRAGALENAGAAPDLERIEVSLLLEGVYRRYGYDFRRYAYAPIKRRLHTSMEQEGEKTLSGLQARLLHDSEAMERLLLAITIHTTAMFRDPSFFVAVRSRVVPLLRTYPFVRLWHAGCSTGEELYSMSILMSEEQLYERARLYATDLNEAVLRRARRGIFPLARMQGYTQNYLAAGGKRSFSDYYTTAYGAARFDRSLIENVVFSQHDLVSDGSFAEFHFISCRNVMIYFDKALQKRCVDLFHDSLVPFGVLALGKRETLRFIDIEERFECIDPVNRIYRKRG